MRQVVVTGLGAVTPLAVGVRRTWTRLLAGECGIVSLPEADPAYSTIPCKIAGLVPRGRKEDGKWTASDWLTPDDERRMAQFTQFAVAAADEALQDAQCFPQLDSQRENIAVCIGSGIGNLSDIYNTSLAFHAGGHKRVHPTFVPRILTNLSAGHISHRHALRGPNMTPTTACTTGLHALAEAALLIRSGLCDSAVAGAAESCIHPLALSGFSRLRSLATGFNDDPGRASRPFDADRDGFVMGEGAGVVVLEEKEQAMGRGARIYAELAGLGMSADAWHMTAPREDGAGAALAMRRALRDAATNTKHGVRVVKPRDVGYVNAHATSTKRGDHAENTAIRDVLLSAKQEPHTDPHSTDGPAHTHHTHPSSIRISSTKGATGHLLGAAGSVEAIFTILALRDNVLPPTLNLERVGPRDAVAGGDGRGEWDCDYVPGVKRVLGRGEALRVAVTNSFGFGGTNASLVFTGSEG